MPCFVVALCVMEHENALNNDFNISTSRSTTVNELCEIIWKKMRPKDQLTIVNDFFSYLTHYLMHTIPFLWEFHKTHHSATTLTVSYTHLTLPTKA